MTENEATELAAVHCRTGSSEIDGVEGGEQGFVHYRTGSSGIRLLWPLASACIYCRIGSSTVKLTMYLRPHRPKVPHLFVTHLRYLPLSKNAL